MPAHLPEEHQPFVEQNLPAAWSIFGQEQASKSLEQVPLELERINPSAARSLAEHLKERLTLHRLGCPEKLRKTLFSTQPIETAFSVVDDKCGRVKKWQGGDVRLRWAARALLFTRNNSGKRSPARIFGS